MVKDWTYLQGSISAMCKDLGLKFQNLGPLNELSDYIIFNTCSEGVLQVQVSLY